MYDIFEKLLAERGLTTADVCRATGISQSTMSNWKKRGNALSPKLLKLIADYFGVSLDYMMGINNDIIIEDGNTQLLIEKSINEDERRRLERFMKIFESFSPDTQEKLIDFAESLQENFPKEP